MPRKKEEQEAVVQDEEDITVTQEAEESGEEEQEPEAPQIAPKPAEPTEFTFNMPAALFQDVVKAVGSIVGYGLEEKDTPEFLLKVDENGITVNKMDKSRVAMISFALTKRGFDNYVCKKAGVMCFNCNDLANVLKGVKKETKSVDQTIKTEGDMLELVVNEPDMTLNLKHSEYNRTFTLRAIVSEDGIEEMPIPKLNHTVTFKTSAKNLRRILDDAVKTGGDHICLTAHNAGIAFDIVSEDTILKYHGDLPKTEKLDEFQAPEGGAKATFNLDFLKNVVENMPKDATVVTCKFSNDMPIQIETGMFDRLTFFMAPRISHE